MTSAPRPSTATTASLIVASPDVALLDRIAELVDELAAERPSVADAPLALVATRGLEAALTLADAVAPEHLELAFEGADETAARARIAGCVFVGAGGATAFGDYAAGSNHVLPTGGAARFGGPLGPGTFRRRTSVVTLPGAWPRAPSPPTWAPWRAPRAFPCTASRPRPGPALDPQRLSLPGLQAI